MLFFIAIIKTILTLCCNMPQMFGTFSHLHVTGACVFFFFFLLIGKFTHSHTHLVGFEPMTSPSTLLLQGEDVPIGFKHNKTT